MTSEILRNFGLVPTSDQLRAIELFARFMLSPLPESAFVLRGSAGTGKTSVASAMVNTLMRLGHKVVLLAPTGRAAKVFALNSGLPAHTIHRKIYRQGTFVGLDTAFGLGDNLHKNTLFAVDEASMLANAVTSEATFGTGRLLDDLVRYVYSGAGCRLMLIGDRAQLPPVGEAESPALESSILRGYGLEVFETDLNEVLRQSRQSGILTNATMLRRMITRDEATRLPQIRLHGFADISVVSGDELVESLSSSYSRVGMDETAVIVRSNKRANVYNQGIRNMILGREEALCAGDRLMVVKNSYHWTEALPREEREQAPPFLANGDVAVVERVRNRQELYGFHFCDAILRFPDYDDFELELPLLTDSLASESPSLTREQQERLFWSVCEDYSDVSPKAARMKRVRADRHFNALQVKYAYAVTCHKAQGGQWAHVYLDQGYMTDGMLSPDYIHWLYTAFTRATEHLFLVNWPVAQTASD